MTSTIDTMAVTSVFLAVSAWTGRLLWHWRGRGAREAATEERSKALDQAQGLELTRLANGLEASNRQFHDHEIECVDFRATTIQTLKSMDKTLTAMSRTQSQIQAQIAHVATGSNNRIFEVRGEQ